VAIGLYNDPNNVSNTSYRYQRVPLDSRFENSKTVTALMQMYQEQLKETGFQGLGIKPIPNRRAAESGQFAGSKSCADCHEATFQKWKKSRHANAWRSLAETSKPPRTFDPECIACHVVGWNPSEFLPYEHGFQNENETPQLLNVGCESCHGPGEFHIQAEQGSDTARQEKFRQSVRLTLEGNVAQSVAQKAAQNAAKKVCIQCHDGDNSPHFNFETYWQKIVHQNEN
jgi:formate-dependent nitrite reductase cytochrome c552 subunit